MIKNQIIQSDLFRIRTITCFVNLDKKIVADVEDFENLISAAVIVLRAVENALTKEQYEVQTLRISTNSYSEWLTAESDLLRLDDLLAHHHIDFCALGPGYSTKGPDDGDDLACGGDDLAWIPTIIQTSPRFSCSFELQSHRRADAYACAQCILAVSRPHGGTAAAHLDHGLGNFRFAVTSCHDYIPFFPAARSNSDRGGTTSGCFAVGLENGKLANYLLEECTSFENVSEAVRSGMLKHIKPVEKICGQVSAECQVQFMGIDTSLNPSLDEGGSVAAALERLDGLVRFNGPGTIATAAAVTKALQSIHGDGETKIKTVGYCGLMLPLCEDRRLAELANGGDLHIADLLMISSVCGVGIDTVPLAGDCSVDELAALLLDVVGLAQRWEKSLSCRVLPMPGKQVGDWTEFDSPHMVNARILPISRPNASES